MDWPDRLIKDLARRKVVVVLGSGVSRHSVNEAGMSPPTWKSFLERACSECPSRDTEAIKDAITRNDFLHACEWLKDKFDENWNDYLRQTFSIPRFGPADIHKVILNLDARIVFSLNFDTIYERCASAINAGSHIVRHYYDRLSSEYLRGDGRYIVKVHGSIDVPEKLIFTQKDYAQARVNHASFYSSFDAALMSHTFLFIGAGYSDPDVNLILENQAFSFPAAAPHYILRPNGESNEMKKSLRANRNLKTIEYDKVDDNHSGLVESLKELVELVEGTRMDLAQNTNW